MVTIVPANCPALLTLFQKMRGMYLLMEGRMDKQQKNLSGTEKGRLWSCVAGNVQAGGKRTNIG